MTTIQTKKKTQTKPKKFLLSSLCVDRKRRRRKKDYFHLQWRVDLTGEFSLVVNEHFSIESWRSQRRIVNRKWSFGGDFYYLSLLSLLVERNFFPVNDFLLWLSLWGKDSPCLLNCCIKFFVGDTFSSTILQSFDRSSCALSHRCANFFRPFVRRFFSRTLAKFFRTSSIANCAKGHGMEPRACRAPTNYVINGKSVYWLIGTFQRVNKPLDDLVIGYFRRRSRGFKFLHLN